MESWREIMEKMAKVVAKASVKIAEDFLLASRSENQKEDRAGLPDFVTKTDLEVQLIIEQELCELYPDIPFIGEEGMNKDIPSSFFLVDPIDGTSNFVALRDYFACCAAYVEDGEVRVAVISDPMRGFLVQSSSGGGVFRSLISSPLERVKLEPLGWGKDSLRKVQLECELAMTKESDFELLRKLVPHMSGMRKSGSTALDMANLALGRKIAVVSSNLEPYDLAAGLLIVKEAGGVVSDMGGGDVSFYNRDVIAASTDVHCNVLSLLSCPK
jgi:myo-inositol-1(or 4)-monophosphatase